MASSDHNYRSDEIECQAKAKLAELTSKCPEMAKYNVLAAFAVSIGNGPDKIVALATAPKCLKGRGSTKFGLGAHVCHAEILARRALMHYFAEQLRLAAEQKPSFFVRIKPLENCDSFRRADDTYLRLYVSSLDCTDDGEKCLSEGRFFSLVFSHKMINWCVLGLQGSVLSNLTRPVYISTFVCGEKFHSLPSDCIRTISDCVSRLVMPKHVYHVKLPIIHSTVLGDSGATDEPIDFSLTWYEGAETFEIIPNVSERVLEQEGSILSKKELFQKLSKIAKQKRWAFPPNYIAARQAKPLYQENKKQLGALFGSKGLLAWIDDHRKSRLYEVTANFLGPFLTCQTEGCASPSEILDSLFTAGKHFSVNEMKDKSGMIVYEALARLDGKTFYGRGPSKNKAKDVAALKALQDYLASNSSLNNDLIRHLKAILPKEVQNVSSQTDVTEFTVDLDLPVHKLKVCFDKVVHFNEEPAEIEDFYTYSATIEGEPKKFIGTAQSKELAKFSAANQALLAIISAPQNGLEKPFDGSKDGATCLETAIEVSDENSNTSDDDLTSLTDYSFDEESDNEEKRPDVGRDQFATEFELGGQLSIIVESNEDVETGPLTQQMESDKIFEQFEEKSLPVSKENTENEDEMLINLESDESNIEDAVKEDQTEAKEEATEVEHLAPIDPFSSKCSSEAPSKEPTSLAATEEQVETDSKPETEEVLFAIQDQKRVDEIAEEETTEQIFVAEPKLEIDRRDELHESTPDDVDIQPQAEEIPFESLPISFKNAEEQALKPEETSDNDFAKDVKEPKIAESKLETEKCSSEAPFKEPDSLAATEVQVEADSKPETEEVLVADEEQTLYNEGASASVTDETIIIEK